MDKINTIEDLANHFRGLADGGIQPFEPLYGICSEMDYLYEGDHLSKEVEDMEIDVSTYFSSWKHYSGRNAYPVPDPDNLYSSEDQFNHVINLEGSMWEGEYGNLRKDLCLHIAKELEKLIEVN